MTMTWRPPLWTDIEPSLLIQPTNRGDGFAGVKEALPAWKYLFNDPFFTGAVLEATPSIQGHRRIGFGSAAFVTSSFMDAEVANPRPRVTARIIAGGMAGAPVLASRNDVAQAGTDLGIDVVILYSAWRDEILSPPDRRALQTLLVSGLVDVLSGFRVRRILAETTSEAVTEFHRRSAEYRVIAEFLEVGSVIHLMTQESATALPGSVGNLIFTTAEPLLRLRESDQSLLLAALRGATDSELGIELGISPAAVKARWRSTFARVGDAMPALLGDANEHEGRGAQKRHRVLAYVRAHHEELRPYTERLRW